MMRWACKAVNDLKKKRNKLNSTATVVDNLRFQSKLEASYYCHLKILQRIGEVKFFLWQVPFCLHGGKKYWCDFLVFLSDGSHRFIDVKGYETDLFKVKKSEVEAKYGVEIHVIKRGDFK